MTCRTQQYWDVVRPQGGVEVTLRAAAAVQLRPLEADAVRSYLCDDAAGPASRARWDPVLKMLGTDAPVGQALDTPLMVGLARAIYNPRPGELAGTLRDPAELCSPSLADRTAVESLLFDAFIPAAYRHDPTARWKAQDAERWLVFLASHLERTIGGPDLAWWQLHEAAPRAAFGIAARLGAWLVAGSRAVSTKAPARSARMSIRGLVRGFQDGLGFGLAFGLGAGLTAGLMAGLTIGPVFGLMFGVVLGLVGGLAGVPDSFAGATSPRRVLARDRQVALLVVILAGLAFWLVVGLTVGLADGLVAGLVGLVVGLWIGFGLSMRQTAWPSYVLSRGWLAFHHHLPWSLMSFLSDAHQRGVLRQAGAVYQFRHIELQHRLANRDMDNQTEEGQGRAQAARLPPFSRPGRRPRRR